MCVVAVLVSVSYVDRPAAEFFHAHIRHTAIWVWMNRLFAPLVLIPLAAMLFLLGAGCRLIAGRPLSVWTRKPLLCSWSIIWGLAAELVFKAVFGRGWPDPTFVENHLYGFRFLHSGPHWASFPSGTAIISTALVATLWHIAPRFRTYSVLLAAVVFVGVVVTNGHWISDVIAGAFLGGSIGWMTVLFFRSEALGVARPK